MRCRSFHRLVLGLLPVFLLIALPANRAALAQLKEASSLSFAEVERLRTEGAFRKAAVRLQALKKQHPNVASVLWRLSIVQVDRAEASDSLQKRRSLYTKAHRRARKALALDSTSAYTHLAVAVAEARSVARAGIKEKIDHSRAVIRHAQRAIDLDSTLAPAYYVRARWNREVADLGAVKRTLVNVMYGGLPDASFEQAVRDFKRAIRLDDKVAHRLELGKTYLRMNRQESAQEEFRIAINMDPIDPHGPRLKRIARQHLNDLEQTPRLSSTRNPR
jgi:tetratricopeptide (TPR) repeat protein